MPRRPPRRFPPVNLDDVREVARLGEAVVRLEESIERQGATIDTLVGGLEQGRDQRGQILELLRAIDKSVGETKTAVTGLDTRITALEKKVGTHEEERQQSIGRRTLLQVGIPLLASLIGAAAGGITVARTIGGGSQR